jgi:hypothetical protein
MAYEWRQEAKEQRELVGKLIEERNNYAERLRTASVVNNHLNDKLARIVLLILPGRRPFGQEILDICNEQLPEEPDT